MGGMMGGNSSYSTKYEYSYSSSSGSNSRNRGGSSWSKASHICEKLESNHFTLDSELQNNMIGGEEYDDYDDYDYGPQQGRGK